eukprot:TRINITY_DN7387_c0_g1_i1.p1 TRINITY_DN7387_c0_g1~~TRINITY_DN7387_c0_g1_i1.p1  ORF type:complete len:353 (-),score=104.50 TRINITY_DN7387_c0_g1_i1:217-1275(-)
MSTNFTDKDRVFFRFLLFPRGIEATLSFPLDFSFKSVKETLKNEWKEANLDEFRLIYSGKGVRDDQIVSELGSNVQGPVTIHVIKRSPPVHVDTQNTANSSQECGADNSGISPTAAGHSDSNQEEFELGSNIHFHGCFFNQEELEQLEVVFKKALERSQRERNIELNGSIFECQHTVGFSDVHKFLQSYWSWMKRTLHKEQSEEFPTEELMKIKRNVLGPNQNAVDFTLFLEIFFLFDNNTPCDTCPHGSRERVKQATEKLHNSLLNGESESAPTTPTPFTSTAYDGLEFPEQTSEAQVHPQIFEQLFEMIDKDRDQVLSCQELELFFYLYSCRVVSEGVVRTNNSPPLSSC